MMPQAPHGYKYSPVGSYDTDVDNEPRPLIDNLRCDLVCISSWNIEDDGDDTPVPRNATTVYDEAGEEIYWGFHGRCGHQIFPQETSFYIFVDNARDISIRASANKTGDTKRCFWSAWKLEPIEKGA